MNFSRETCAQLGAYVYALLDPRTDSIFYVGKANGNNRAFDHLKGATGEGAKVARIRDIRAAGLQPIVEILRFGLKTDAEALEVEAAVIDTIGLENLTNMVRGQHTTRGRRSAGELERMFGSRPVDIEGYSDPTLLFFIHNSYSPTLTEQEIYDCTRQFWTGVSRETRTPGADALHYRTALGVVDSVVMRAYEIKAWLPAGTTMSSRTAPANNGGRVWEFVGNLLPNHPLVGKRLLLGGSPLPAARNGFRYLPLRTGDRLLSYG